MKKKVLSDHHRTGKIFIPPMMKIMPEMTETVWSKDSLPELLWISCLILWLGHRRGVEVAVQLALQALKAKPEIEGWYSTISSFKQITHEQWAAIKADLTDDQLRNLRGALRDLQHFYPEAPFEQIVKSESEQETESPNLRFIKEAVEVLYDKMSRHTTFVIGTATCIGFASNRLKVAASTVLADFQKVEDYPNTPESKMIASALRAMIPFLTHGTAMKPKGDWVSYFWKRGLELEKCYFPKESS